MENAPAPSKNIESPEAVANPNAIFEWGFMPKNTDVPTTSEHVYRQVRAAGADDLLASGVVRNAASAGAGNARKYGDRVYWTRGKDGEYHNVQPDHVVLEAPYVVANARTVKLEDLIGIHARNESGVVENRINAASQMQDKAPLTSIPSDADAVQLAEVRDRLGLEPNN